MPEKVGTIKVCGSEYSPSENAMIYSQVLNADGTPANTATVTLNIFSSGGIVYVSGQSMAYINNSNGLYQYAFSAPANSQRMIADVSATSPTAYGVESISVSELAINVDSVKKIESGRWKIANNQMIFYDEDTSSAIFTFNLLDSGGSPSSTTVYERRPV